MDLSVPSLLNAIQGTLDEVSELNTYYEYIENSVPTEEYLSKSGEDIKKSILSKLALRIQEKEYTINALVAMLPERMAD